MNNLKNRSFKVAFGGIVAALSLVFMFSTGIIPTLTYAVPAVCGALLMILVIEVTRGFALSVYLAVAILSLLIVADKEAAVMYTAFFGYYPVIKSIFEYRLKKVMCRTAKYAVFNTAMIVSYFIASKVFGIEYDEVGLIGKYTLFFLLAIGNVVFCLYDIALTRLVSAYLYRWRKYVKRFFK